jgi:hypothetical protein
MAIYTIAQRTTFALNTAAPAAEVRSASTNKPKIMEFGFSQNVAPPTGGTTYGLGRAAAVGLTPTAPVNVLDEQDGNAGNGLSAIAVAWGTAPTVPAAFFRRATPNNLVGAGMIWTFPRGLALTPTSSVVLWVIAVAGASSSILDVWAVMDE